MELKKGQKQGRDEITQEDYPASAKIHSSHRRSVAGLVGYPMYPWIPPFYGTDQNYAISITEVGVAPEILYASYARYRFR